MKLTFAGVLIRSLFLVPCIVGTITAEQSVQVSPTNANVVPAVTTVHEKSTIDSLQIKEKQKADSEEVKRIKDSVEAKQKADSLEAKRKADSVETVLKYAAAAGMDCEAPEFSFKRLTPRTFILFAKSKNPVTFNVNIYALGEDTGATRFISDSARVKLITVGRISALPEPGYATDVYFQSLDPVFQKGGMVRVTYDSANAGVCTEKLHGYQIVTVVPEHQIDFNVGRLYNLEQGGRWDASGEFGVQGLSHWNTWFAGLFEFHFAQIGKIDSALDTGAVATKISNPFLSQAGSLSLDMSLEISPTLFFEKWGGGKYWMYPQFFDVGVGFRSPPGDLDMTNLRPRVFGGIGVRVDDYNINGSKLNTLSTSGCVRALLAADGFYKWQDLDPNQKPVDHDEYLRFVLEGELEIPGIGSKDLKPCIRGFMDTPFHSLHSFFLDRHPYASNGISKSSPSRVGISLLLHVQMEALETLFSAH